MTSRLDDTGVPLRRLLSADGHPQGRQLKALYLCGDPPWATGQRNTVASPAEPAMRIIRDTGEVAETDSPATVGRRNRGPHVTTDASHGRCTDHAGALGRPCYR